MERPAVLRLTRESVFANSLAKFSVAIDGKKVGTIADGDIVEFTLDPGSHSLRVRMNWTGSPSLTFSVDEGETLNYTCRPAGTNPMLALFYLVRSVIDRDSWIILERS